MSLVMCVILTGIW